MGRRQTELDRYMSSHVHRGRKGRIHIESRTRRKEGTDTYRVTYTEEGRDRYISSHVHGGRKGQIHIESRTRRKEGTDTYRVRYTEEGRDGYISSHVHGRRKGRGWGGQGHVETNNIPPSNSKQRATLTGKRNGCKAQRGGLVLYLSTAPTRIHFLDSKEPVTGLQPKFLLLLLHLFVCVRVCA